MLFLECQDQIRVLERRPLPGTLQRMQQQQGIDLALIPDVALQLVHAQPTGRTDSLESIDHDEWRCLVLAANDDDRGLLAVGFQGSQQLRLVMATADLEALVFPIQLVQIHAHRRPPSRR